ncbi:uncharacterized protein EAE97_005031 [Botrytis byssoidea]|uniref:Uncharacterized protein n=1 Tax=Botrytis byssoidea TaxID=139641 RepID=A0A9P5INY2_9HELO|nr:uncharacterized protein EAE97_005031 [Botrytis byssoidea]KAF7945993.1 hypothetical protein EAE97_005031 [Botrytis byssoidea]
MPKSRNSISRTTRFRRKPYSHLPDRAPLPDLVALHENGTLFSDPRAMTESATEEESAGTRKRKSRRESNAVQPNLHLRASNPESQSEEDELANSQSRHNTPSHFPENEHLTYPPTPSNPQSNIQQNRFPSSNSSSTTKTNSISPHSLRQRRRGLPDLRIITSPTRLAELKNGNLNNTFMEIPLPELKQRELETQTTQAHQELRFQNPISESQTHRDNWRSQESENHNRKTRDHYVPNPPRQQRKIRLRKNGPPRPHPRTRYSFISESPDTSPDISSPTPNPNSPPFPNPNPEMPSPNRIIPSTLSPNVSPPPPQLLPAPLANPLTPTQYISAILALRASTRNPDHFPLPPGIQHSENLSQQQQQQKKNKKERERAIHFLALQMEQVEDAIRLEGAPEEAREVYYAQFARGED